MLAVLDSQSTGSSWTDSIWPPKYTAHEPLTVITVLLICAFAIDRIVTGILALLRSSASKARSRKVYLVLAGVLGVLLGVVGNVGVLGNLEFSTNPFLNVALTTLILMGGSDRIGALMAKMGGEPAAVKHSDEPIEITGKLVLLNEGRTGENTVETVAASHEHAKPETAPAASAAASGQRSR